MDVYNRYNRDTNAVAYSLTQLTAPVLEFVSLARAKRKLSIGHTDDDENILADIESARSFAEAHTGLAFGPRDYLLEFPYWPQPCGWGYPEFPFPVEPVNSVASFTYKDYAEVDNTLDPAQFIVWTRGSPPVLRIKVGFGYPSLALNYPNPIAITFNAGLATVPPVAASAALLMLEYWYSQPGGGEPGGNVERGMPDGAVRLLNTIWTGKL